MTKNWALANLNAETINAKKFFLEISLYFNRGISFSYFQDSSLFLVIPVLFLFLFFTVNDNIKNKKWRIRSGSGLLFAGAIGNLIDRAKYGYVIDWFFVGVHMNLADLYLIFGCFIYLFNLKNEK